MKTPVPKPVQTLTGMSADALPEEVFASPVPLHLEACLKSWPAVQHCNSLQDAKTWLSRSWSDKPITVFVGDQSMKGRFSYNEDFSGFNFRSGKSTLPEVFQKLGDAKRPASQTYIYVGSSPTRTYLPGFSEENRARVPSDDPLISVWLGNKTRISAHYDFPDNLACVVSGRRRFTLFPPGQVSNLYVGPIDRTPAGQAISLVDFANPDFARHPKFREALAHAITAELAPGDALFIPSLWWHHVEALDDFNMLINYWWISNTRFEGDPTGALMHAILSIRDLPSHQRQAWQKLFAHYVFEADAEVYEHIPEQGRGRLAPLGSQEARLLKREILSRLK